MVFELLNDFVLIPTLLSVVILLLFILIFLSQFYEPAKVV